MDVLPRPFAWINWEKTRKTSAIYPMSRPRFGQSISHMIDSGYSSDNPLIIETIYKQNKLKYMPKKRITVEWLMKIWKEAVVA
jgi:hypothetical protein